MCATPSENRRLNWKDSTWFLAFTQFFQYMFSLKQKEIIFGVAASLCDFVSLATGGRSEKTKHPNAHKLRAMGMGLLENLHRGEESCRS